MDADDITGLCRDHSFESSAAVCRRCGHEFCEDCIVTPKGSSKPLCKECAMVLGGVRVHSPIPAQSNRVIRKRVKAFEKKTRRVATIPPEEAPALVDPVLQDWLDSSPAEEERQPAHVPATAEAAAPPTGADVAAAHTAPTLSTTDEPADGVAPPIDWNKPFG